MVAEDSDSKRTAKGEGERRTGRSRRRAPVTIDLKAEKVEARAAETAKADAGAAAADKSEAAQDAAAVQDRATSKAEAPPAKPASSTQRSDAPQRPAAGAARVEPSRSGEGWRPYVIAGLAGGVAVFILIALLQMTGLLPAPGRTTAGQAIEQAQGAADTVAALERRVMALEAMTETLPASIDRLDNVATAVDDLQASSRSREPVVGEVESLKTSVATLGGQLDVADASLDALGRRVDRLASATTTGTAAAAGDGGSAEAIAALSDQIGQAESSLTSLGERVEAVEKSVAALESAPAMGGEGGRAARAVAVAALRQAAGAGGGFASDLAVVSALGISGEAIATLRPLAADGAPSTAELAAEFPTVADAILAATSGDDADAGFFQRLFGGISGLVSVRPAGPVAGSDPAAIVSRMQAAVDRGDLDAALKERDALPDAGQRASATWAAAAANRARIDALVDQIAEAVDTPAGN